MYRLLWRFGRLLFRLLYHVEIRGTEHLPAEGPIVLSANHSSFLDPILIALGVPRPIRYMTFYTYVKMPVLGWLIRALGAFPVYQTGMDKRAVATALKVLQEGQPLVIFPEGRLTTDGRLQEGKLGAARIAARAGAPLIPISIRGAFSVYPKGRRFPRLHGRISVIFHPPIPVDPSRSKDKAYLEALTQRLMATIQSGLPKEAWPLTSEVGVSKEEGLAPSKR